MIAYINYRAICEQAAEPRSVTPFENSVVSARFALG